MLERLAELPFWQAFTALFVIVLARSNATYWVGRGAIAGWRRRRARPGSVRDTVRDTVHGGDASTGADARTGTDAEADDRRARAEALIHRLGPVAVALSYLTVGIQTTIHLTAGVLRMPMRYYLPAAVVGSVAWAALYATIGLAVVQAWIAARAGSWWALGGLVALVVVGLATWLLSRSRRQRRSAPEA